MMAEAMDNIEEGVNVGGEIVRDVRFADDQGMIASTEAGLQKIMDKLNLTAKKYEMKINVAKTKAMVISKTGGKEVNIQIDGQPVEQVNTFKYLGVNITENGRSTKEIKMRIGQAKAAFGKRKELLTRKMDTDIKKRIIKTLIWPIALYACETWTLHAEDYKRLNAFEMWIWRRMEKISWTEKRTNDEVLERVKERRQLVQTIIERKRLDMCGGEEMVC
jgi:hypothetical protein